MVVWKAGLVVEDGAHSEVENMKKREVSVKAFASLTLKASAPRVGRSMLLMWM